MSGLVYGVVVCLSMAGGTVASFGDGLIEKLDKCWFRDGEHELTEVGGIVLFEEEI